MLLNLIQFIECVVKFLKTVSKQIPEKKFEIDKNPNGRCTILFYDNITKNEFKERYEYDLYRYETIYRPNLEKIIENDYDSWFIAAKSREKAVKIVENKETDTEKKCNCLKEDNKILLDYIMKLEHRIMKLECEVYNLKNPKTIKLKSRIPENFDLSPYEKLEHVIENKKSSYDEILQMMKDFVDNKYLTEDEFSDLLDLLDEVYEGE